MTEDQKSKLKALDKKYFRKGLRRGFKHALFFVTITLLSFVVNCLLFQPPNKTLGFIFGLINGVATAIMIRSDFIKAKKEIEEDVRKVFEE